ncbi:bifunctional DNA-formamidopyrimidine glycosylase/DNA-(apurinic or apyrimidinic site) lyase [Rothia sp. HC945]|uniref:bifunctional DNA-formamidopyrimidine glycosylase/DNA-(apurinic or apyrimidinic site) lyase n=1 Tax=Rothia sp. HC945 TaxID=3171170 RepID=UPI003F20D183
MPELPEVEVVRSGLARHILGARIDAVEVLETRSLRRDPGAAAEFAAFLRGQKIVDVCRRGKYMWLRLSAGPKDGAPHSGPCDPTAVVVHLGMSGQVLLTEPGAPDHRHVRLRFSLTGPDGGPLEMRFVDQRIFGGMYRDPVVAVVDHEERPVPAASSSVLDLAEIPGTVSHIGRDPLDPHFDEAAFRRRLRATSSGIKRVLLDQSTISGIGNIYADEALWRSRLHYAKPARSVTKSQAEELLAACTEVMTAALAEGGTSFDALYVNVNGESGYFERGLNVYGRSGEPCKRCGALVVRERFMNRSSYFCPVCQRGR